MVYPSGLPNHYAYRIEPFYDSIDDGFEFNAPANQDMAALSKVGFERQQGLNTRHRFISFPCMQLSIRWSMNHVNPAVYRLLIQGEFFAPIACRAPRPIGQRKKYSKPPPVQISYARTWQSDCLKSAGIVF
jgi:hypothetical protein